jgi:hypothetical protein
VAARGVNVPQACSVPELTAPRVFDPLAEWDSRGELLKYGVELCGTPGAESRVIIDEAAPPPQGRLRVEFFGGRDQLVVVDGRHKVEGYARLEASAQTLLVAAGGAGAFHAHSIILRGRYTCIALGAQATSNGAKLLVDGDQTSLIIGDDSMLAHDIEILATDSHAMFYSEGRDDWGWRDYRHEIAVEQIRAVLQPVRRRAGPADAGRGELEPASGTQR